MTARPQTTVLEALAGRLAADPDGPYLDFEGVGYSARGMDAESNRLAHALARLGVGKGDRVATLLENSPAQVVTFFAALKLGAVQVPVNTAYKGDFLRHQLVDSGSKVIVVQGDFAGRVGIGGGRHLFLECAGSGRPVVVFEAGLRNRGDIWSVQADEGKRRTMVFPGVAAFTRVCAYDRPGTTLGADPFSRSW